MGTLLIAFGIVLTGSFVSPAVTPIISIPTNENNAIWKDIKNPEAPLANMPCSYKFETGKSYN